MNFIIFSKENEIFIYAIQTINFIHRVSRIAIPLNRISKGDPGARKRSTSIDNSTRFSSSAVKISRSSSATPMRTPIRPIPYTPGVYCTSEKAPVDDKRWVAAQIAIINEYIRDFPELGNDFFQRGGLKTMTTKQFVIIVSNLMKFTFGTGKQYTIGTNYVDDIVRNLHTINYPYNINKSWLKTPTAPHTLCHVVALLGWLLEFSNSVATMAEFDDIENDLPFEEMTNPSFTSYFSKTTAAAFNVWNNQHESEFEDIKTSLVDELINIQTDMPNIESIENDMDRLQAEIDNLLANKIVIENEDVLIGLQTTVAKLNSEKKLLQESSKTLSRQKIKSEEYLHYQNTMIHELESEIHQSERLIDAQEITVEEKNHLLSKISKNSMILSSLKNIITDLEETEISNRIQHNKMTKVQTDLIAKINKCLYQASTNNIPIDVNDLKIDLQDDNDLDYKISKIITIANKLKLKILADKSSDSIKMQEMQQQITRLTHKNEEANKNLQQWHEKGKEIDAELEKLLEQVYMDISAAKMNKERYADEVENSRKLHKVNEDEIKEKFNVINEIDKANKKLLIEFKEYSESLLINEETELHEMAQMLNQCQTEVKEAQFKLNKTKSSFL